MEFISHDEFKRRVVAYRLSWPGRRWSSAWKEGALLRYGAAQVWFGEVFFDANSFRLSFGLAAPLVVICKTWMAIT